MHDATTGSDSSLVETPAPLGRTLLFALFALVSSLGLTSWLEQSSSETFVATLRAHRATIAAGCDGQIQRVLAEEGQVLASEQPVVVLTGNGLASRLSQKRLDAASMEVDVQRIAVGSASTSHAIVVLQFVLAVGRMKYALFQVLPGLGSVERYRLLV